MRKTVRIFLVLAAFFAATTSQAVILQNIGTGSDVSHFYLQFSDPLMEAVHYQYFYDYDEDTPLTGAQMIYNISTTLGSGLTYDSAGSDTGLGGNVYYNTLSYGTSTQTVDYIDEVGWSYFVAGGENAIYSQTPPYGPVWGPGGEGDYTFASIPSGSWSYSPVGASDRVIMPGSWDSWTYGSWSDANMPAISPVPEPSTWALIGVAVLIPLARRFRRHSA